MVGCSVESSLRKWGTLEFWQDIPASVHAGTHDTVGLLMLSSIFDVSLELVSMPRLCGLQRELTSQGMPGKRCGRVYSIELRSKSFGRRILM